jgi:RNA polymerase sigma-70 factor (ECF subfamily)
VAFPSDDAIARSLRAERPEAFDLLFARYGGPLLGFLQRMVGDRATAEDLLQETMVRIFHGIRRYREEGNFRAWIYRIAANLAVSHLRRSRHFVADPDPILRRRPDEQAPDPQVALETSEAERDLRLALAALPAEQRTVVLLRLSEGLTLAEIGQVLCVPEGTVKSRLHYAVIRLRAQLASARPPAMEGWRA